MLKSDEYRLFKDYPEMITVKEMRKMLGGITKYAALRLIYDKKVCSYEIARMYRIPKASVIDYIIKQIKAVCPEIPDELLSYLK